MTTAQTSGVSGQAHAPVAPASVARPARGGALRLLGLAVVATTVGMTAATFRGDGTAINAFLFLTGQLSHVAAAQIERAAMSLVLLLSLVALLRPHWILLLPVSGYIFAEALARWHERGHPYSEWALFAQSPRYLTPLALVLFVVVAGRADWFARGSRMAADVVLRAGLAVVFAVHGLESLRANPEFVDLIISTAANLAGVRVSERTATLLLDGIGLLDMAVAAAILLRPRPAVLWWAACWGAVTAVSRITASGFGAYPEFLIRTTHILGPVALWLLASRASAEKTSAPPAAASPARSYPPAIATTENT